ncbi:MAG: DUF167 domain-containing protein [bacterium]|nr:DUF167 domain-containing protein [bacterium]
MQLNVQVKPQAKKDEVLQVNTDHLQVKTTAAAQDNQANLAMIKLVAQYLGLKKSQIIIVAGEKNKNKIIQILKR